MVTRTSSGSPPKFRRALRLGRSIAINLILPIALAWGVTHALHQRLYPGDVRDAPATRNEYGKIKLRIKLPGTHAGILEPLISCGKIGNATLVFIRLLPNNRARVGVEFWGLELNQGAEFTLPSADAEISVVCFMPGFFPEEKDSAWGSISPELQKIRRHEYVILVDDVVRLKGTVNYTQPPHSPLYVGANPLGGSFISSRFTGAILQFDEHF